MNRKQMMRLFSALLCAVLLFADVPADMLRAAADDGEWYISEASLEAPAESGDVPADEAESAPVAEDAEAGPEAPEGAEEGDAAPGEPETPGDGTPSQDEEPSPEDELRALAAGWVSDLDAQGVQGDYARALWLYDRLIVNFERGSEDEALPAMAALSGSALGYARTYAALLDAAGIENATAIEGDAAWNLAKLDGEWTHIDAYADDAPDCYGTHFGLSDAAMARDHAWSAELPACGGAQSSYFVRERGYRAFVGSDELRTLLSAALDAGEAELLLYNAGEALDLSEALTALLSELNPEAEIHVSEKGCYAAATLRIPAAEESDDAAPDSVEAPTSMELNTAGGRVIIGVKETLQLIPAFYASGALTEGKSSVSYKSSKTAVASVSAEGVVTAKKAGKATITASAVDGSIPPASVTITVKKAPSSISIVASRTVLGVGEPLQLDYKLTSGSMGTVTFSIPEEQQSIATVTPEGMITPRAPGTVTVTAKTHNNKKKTQKLEIKPAPETIEFVGAPESLGEGSSCKLVAQLSAGSAGQIQYRVTEFQAADGSDAEVAYIDADGTIHARVPGSVTVVASTCVEDLAATAKFEVVPGPDAVLLPAKSIELGVSDTYQIVPEASPEGSAATYTYKSNKKSIATVNANGLVTGKKTGKATITVKAYNGASINLTVNVKKKPSKVTLPAAEQAPTLGVGETLKLNPAIPKDSATTLRYESGNPAAATVDQSGTITAVSEGQAVITVSTHNNKTAKSTVSVVPAPTAIEFEEINRISVGQENFTPKYTLTPANAHASLRYELLSGDGIQIEDNRIVAAGKGEAVLRAYTQADGVYGDFTLTVVPVPENILLPENIAVQLGSEGVQIEPTLDPVEAAADLNFKITGKKKNYFSVDAQTGWVTPKAVGRSEVTVTTQNTPKSVSAKTTVWVVKDLSKPEVLEYRGDSPYVMDRGETYIPDLYVFPEGADPKLSWTSSSPKIASVDSNGVVTGLSSGRSTITGTSASNAKLSVKYKVIVLSDDRCLVMPDHRTKDQSTIESNLEQIEKVRDSAHAELDELEAAGLISSSERKTRTSYVNRAFDMFAFPWSPNAKKYYWKAANSEGGKKDFKKDTIYYGMPYTQSSRTNYPKKLINNNYVKAESNFYRTTNKFKSRSYPGSDCSSFCSMAVWGYNSGRNSDTTSGIASASYYKTLGSKYWQDLRPGDLICAGGHHVVMFLYYTNEARTQFVVIEQGGGGDDKYSNCVSTSIYDYTYYKSRSYKIRRPKGLDTTYVADR